jgi:hypothetical protein
MTSRLSSLSLPLRFFSPAHFDFSPAIFSRLLGHSYSPSFTSTPRHFYSPFWPTTAFASAMDDPNSHLRLFVHQLSAEPNLSVRHDLRAIFSSNQLGIECCLTSPSACVSRFSSNTISWYHLTTTSHTTHHHDLIILKFAPQSQSA